MTEGTSLRINVVLPTDLLDALNTAARERAVGRGLLIERLLRDGLDRLTRTPEPCPASRFSVLEAHAYCAEHDGFVLGGSTRCTSRRDRGIEPCHTLRTLHVYGMSS